MATATSSDAGYPAAAVRLLAALLAAASLHAPASTRRDDSRLLPDSGVPPASWQLHESSVSSVTLPPRGGAVLLG